ncbi:MAG: hypothetical protein IRZ16_00310 [Myxococcaceae bacterium]|nr:hypothetical protein [Myxococcaceae bacterium]
MQLLELRGVLLSSALALALVGTVASAQQTEEYEYTERTTIRPQSKMKQTMQDLVDRPVAVRVGGGMEGVAGALDDRLGIGPHWNATLSAQPLPFMGAEIAYNGATHDVDNNFPGTVGSEGAVGGADFVSNGGQAAVTFNLPTPIVQPYALGGIGFDHFEFRGAETSTFRDDTAGRVPVGGGLKSNMGALSADLRFNYNILFSQNFARSAADPDIGGTYNLALQVGARF